MTDKVLSDSDSDFNLCLAVNTGLNNVVFPTWIVVLFLDFFFSTPVCLGTSRFSGRYVVFNYFTAVCSL